MSLLRSAGNICDEDGGPWYLYPLAGGISFGSPCPIQPVFGEAFPGTSLCLPHSDHTLHRVGSLHATGLHGIGGARVWIHGAWTLGTGPSPRRCPARSLWRVSRMDGGETAQWAPRSFACHCGQGHDKPSWGSGIWFPVTKRRVYGVGVSINPLECLRLWHIWEWPFCQKRWFRGVPLVERACLSFAAFLWLFAPDLT